MKKTISNIAKQLAIKITPLSETDKLEVTTLHETQQALIDSFSNKDTYYNQMNFVSDEKLINYYSYLLKAEDEKIGYLQKLLLSMQVQS